MSDVITGRRPQRSGRRPKTVDERRVCADRGCDTLLSRYNRAEHCFTHRPTRFPRVRGHVQPAEG